MDYKIAVAVIIGVLLAGALSYLIWLKSASQTSIFLYPREIGAIVGGNFAVFIRVSDVSDLYSWHISLKWNATMLELINVTEGSFLRNKGQTFFFKTKVNEDKVSIECTLTEDIMGASGKGILAKVEFRAKQRGTCTIQVYESELLNSRGEKVNHSVSSCIVHVQFMMG